MNNSKGFSLLEIMIATGILAFLSLGINSIVSSTADTKDEVTKEDRAYLQVYTALNRMEVDITQIYSPLYFTVKEKTLDEVEGEARASGKDFDRDTYDNPGLSYQGSEKYPAISRSGEPIGAIVNDDKSSLIFSTMSNRRKLQDSKESRFAWVKYSLGSISKDEELKGDDLVRNFTAVDPYSKEFDWESTESQVLLQNVKSLTFEFYDKSKEKWVEKLSETALDKDTPRAIKVKLVWINESENEIEFERIFRPLWPYFDTLNDEKERQKALKGDGQDAGGLGGNDGSGGDDKDE
ncbi:MAG: hypothetical protein CME70_23040 [Halobacteriovorax sp.]|nr:hypothetical protein [Halobacteriovorax sp.]|tara:strand:- start:37188 stop:38069 length:882 start_codon:yes stop_codon:yes gene_type:complete